MDIFIGRIENFTQDFNKILSYIGITFRPPKTNESYSSNWQSNYNHDLADFVYRFYERDFKMFGYEKNSWQETNSNGTENISTSDSPQFLYNEIYERNRLIQKLYDKLDDYRKHFGVID